VCSVPKQKKPKKEVGSALGNDASAPKPRIQIKLKGSDAQKKTPSAKSKVVAPKVKVAPDSKAKKKEAKPKNPSAAGSLEGTTVDGTATPSTKKNAAKAKKAKATELPSEASPAPAETMPETADKPNEAQDDPYLDLDLWKKFREGLDGSFESARSNLIRMGPWTLPEAVGDSKFKEVAKATLAVMDRHDRYSVFAHPVTDEEAPDYSDVVKNPVDFSSMRKKIEGREYGRGSEAAAAFYEDFVLLFDNCRLYNPEDGEVVEEAARVLGLLPEAYVGACIKATKQYGS
jgi:Bromodomain